MKKIKCFLHNYLKGEKSLKKSKVENITLVLIPLEVQVVHV